MWVDDEFNNKANPTDDLNQCLYGSHDCILVTDWQIHTTGGLESLVEQPKRKVFFDGRRVFSRKSIPQGLAYRTVGTY